MNFKNYLYILIFLLFASLIPIVAQDDELDDLDFEYQELEEEATQYFTIGGGAILNLSFFDFSSVNQHLATNNFGFIGDNNKIEELDGLVYQFGGQGFVTIGLIPNIRIGFIGFGGSNNLKKTFLDANNDPKFTRNFEISTSFAGITIDYAIVPIKDFKFAILPGISVGMGNISLESYQTEKSFSWNNYKPDSLGNNFYSKLQADYWQITPMLNLEYAPTTLALFRVGIGYSITSMNNWHLNRNQDMDVSDMPDAINGNGLSIQFGIFLGLFNY